MREAAFCRALKGRIYRRQYSCLTALLPLISCWFSHCPNSVDSCREGKPVDAVPRHSIFLHPATGRKRMENQSGKAGETSPAN